MDLYSSYVQFMDGTHDNYIGLAENGLVIMGYAKKAFGKEVIMTHSRMIAPDVDEVTDDMKIEAKVWYGIRENMEGMHI